MPVPLIRRIPFPGRPTIIQANKVQSQQQYLQKRAGEIGLLDCFRGLAEGHRSLSERGIITTEDLPSTTYFAHLLAPLYVHFGALRGLKFPRRSAVQDRRQGLSRRSVSRTYTVNRSRVEPFRSAEQVVQQGGPALGGLAAGSGVGQPHCQVRRTLANFLLPTW